MARNCEIMPSPRRQAHDGHRRSTRNGESVGTPSRAVRSAPVRNVQVAYRVERSLYMRCSDCFYVWSVPKWALSWEHYTTR